MSTRPWMPFYINDFRLDTLDLPTDHIGVYVLLICLTWMRDDAALPNDMKWLKRSLQACIADFHGLSFNRIVPYLLKRYFELGPDDKWRNKRVTKERFKALEKSENQSRNAYKRWHGTKNINRLLNANAMPPQSHIERKKEVGGISESLEHLIKAKGWTQ